MKRISSATTFLYKRVPTIAVGALALVIIGLVIDIVTGARWTVTRTLLGPCLVVWMASWSCVMTWMASGVMNALELDLADDVLDEGQHLVVRRGAQSERIAISNIAEVNEPMFARQPRLITLRLVQPGKLGREISFAPAGDFASNPFSRSHIATDLTQRAAAARAEKAG